MVVWFLAVRMLFQSSYLNLMLCHLAQIEVFLPDVPFGVILEQDVPGWPAYCGG